MTTIEKIFEKSLRGRTPSNDELLSLLNLDENSKETHALRGCADTITRKRFKNQVMILGQIGIENRACPANCQFCSFAEYVNKAEETMSFELVEKKALEMAFAKRIDALFLMGMHHFEQDYFLKIIARLRKIVPQKIKIVVNIGDSSKDYFSELKKLGVSGAYHVCRLREGIDTNLKIEDRLNTIDVIKSLGLDWYNCCEPVGSEHTNEEILEQILLGNQFKCFQHAAMGRVNFAGSSLSCKGEVSKARISQIVAVVTLASIENNSLTSIAIHEPDVISINSGANCLYAESGKNPRDTASDTSQNRGLSIDEVVEMLKKSNFEV